MQECLAAKLHYPLIYVLTSNTKIRNQDCSLSTSGTLIIVKRTYFKYLFDTNQHIGARKCFSNIMLANCENQISPLRDLFLYLWYAKSIKTKYKNYYGRSPFFYWNVHYVCNWRLYRKQ